MNDDAGKADGSGAPDNETFLARWSRRKRAAPEARGERDFANGPADAATPAVASAKASGKASVGEAVDHTKLPRVDDLRPSDSIEAFLRSGVPEALQRLAMRKAWVLDPAIRDFVEMAENQYDWNVPGGVPGFGDIAPGTDVTALLDQAIGKLARAGEGSANDADVTKELRTTAAAEGDQSLPSVIRPVGAAAGAATDARPASDAQPAVRSDAPPEKVLVAEQDPGAVRRRRHGGALPG